MAEVFEIKRNRPNYGVDLLQGLAPGLNKGVTAQSDAMNMLYPLLLKAQIEKQSKLDEIKLRVALGEQMREKLARGGNGPLGDFSIELDEYGVPTKYHQKSPTEKKAEKELSESSGLANILPQFAKYALGATRPEIPSLSPEGAITREEQDPTIAQGRVNRLQSKLGVRYPSQFQTIKNIMSGYKPLEETYDTGMKDTGGESIYGTRPRGVKAVGGKTPAQSDVQVRSLELVKNTAQDTLDTIAKIKQGKRYFGAAGVIQPFPFEYSKKEWSNNLNKLLSQRVLDVMMSLKMASKTGATGFGQLSEKELKVLQDASTALKKNISEESAMEYLTKMENVAKKILTPSTKIGKTYQDYLNDIGG
jgi:hypothetical protein